MQIRTFRKGLEVFKCQFEQFKMDSKVSKPNSNHSKGIQSIRKVFEAVENKFEPFVKDSKHSNGNTKYSKRI